MGSDYLAPRERSAMKELRGGGRAKSGEGGRAAVKSELEGRPRRLELKGSRRLPEELMRVRSVASIVLQQSKPLKDGAHQTSGVM
ncbi:uncharacterized protein A4U43_C08F35630 [Asparagus officinalis]|nr:uncharacterized protein A4U43_C08F35630 [Asparagus officinalis]